MAYNMQILTLIFDVQTLIDHIFFQNLDNSSVYINAIILGGVNIAVFAVAGVAVNNLGKKTLQGKLEEGKYRVSHKEQNDH